MSKFVPELGILGEFYYICGMIDNTLFHTMRQILRHTPTSFRRYVYDKLPDNARLIGLTGPRGVGKSTLVLQKILQRDPDRSLYVDADNIYFSTHSLLELANEMVKSGRNFLVIDEIHKYKNWSKELKQIHDTLPELQVIFTGSSILDIKKGEADLSRRALMFHIQGLSFREYLGLYKGVEIAPYTLQEILEHRVDLPEIPHPLPDFHQYLQTGYFPFSHEPEFGMRLNQIISQTVETDIPLFADMMATTARKLKQLLGVLSNLAPYKPSIEKLSVEVGVSKNTLPEYLSLLERAGMISLLRDDTNGLRSLGKVEKLYLDNPNFMYALAGVGTDIGNVRETFFQNQVRVTSAVRTSRIADFKIGDKIFEVGGKNKGQRQLEGDPNGYIVKDDIEFGSGNIIPLWHFGLIY